MSKVNLLMGEGQEALNEAFEILEETPEMDAIVRRGETMDIRVSKAYTGSCAFAITYNTDQMLDKGVKHQARGWDKLNKFIGKAFQSCTFNDNTRVLALLQVPPSKSWTGEIRTVWAELQYPIPYFVDEHGNLSFKTREILMSAGEVKVCAETGIALIRAQDDKEIIYALSEESFDSIGKALDAQKAFKKTEDVPLGSAIILCQRMGDDLGSYNLCCQTVSPKVKKVRCYMSGNYDFIPHNILAKEVFKYLEQFNCQYEVGDWELVPDKMALDINIKSSMEKPYELGIYIENPLKPNETTQAIAYVNVSGHKVMLGKTKLSHTKGCCNRVNELITTELLKTLENFENTYKVLSGKTVSFNDTMVKDIANTLGTKRINVETMEKRLTQNKLNEEEVARLELLKELRATTSSAWDLFEKLVQATYVEEFSSKLMSCYNASLTSILEECA